MKESRIRTGIFENGSVDMKSLTQCLSMLAVAATVSWMTAGCELGGDIKADPTQTSLSGNGATTATTTTSGNGTTTTTTTSGSSSSSTLPAPKLLFPADGATGVVSPTLLEWTSVPGADHYKLEGVFTFGDTVVADLFDDIPASPGDAWCAMPYTLHWRVWAVDSNGNEGDVSDTFTLTFQ